MTDVVEQTRQEIQERLRQLEPLVEEYRRLEAAVSALSGLGAPSSETKPGAASRGRTTRKRKPARGQSAAKGARTKANAPAARGRPGRRKGSGTRAAEVLALVQGQPGITIPELATKMGIKRNYLYRVLPGLEQEGQIHKSGKGWDPDGP